MSPLSTATVHARWYDMLQILTSILWRQFQAPVSGAYVVGFKVDVNAQVGRPKIVVLL